MRISVMAVYLALTVSLARADPALQDTIARAQRAIDQGEFSFASSLASRAIEQAEAVSDRAEAYRLLGLAEFFSGHRPAAERAFVRYLELDPDAHLDPALVPPEAVVFFSKVRSAYATDISARRPSKRKQYWVANLLPPFGQFQNGHRSKGWIVAGLGIAAIATNVGSYVTLKQICEDDSTCPGHTATAKALRVTNIAAGVAAILLYSYGVADGFYHYRSSVSVVPSGDGGVARLTVAF